QLFMIDDLPTLPSTGKNIAPQQAQSVSPPVAIDGVCEPLASTFFRITLKKSERLSIEVVAQRLGSRMDPLIRVLDASGQELAYCDDTPGIGSDCRLVFVAPVGGDYLLALRDANYEGGPQHRFRLRLGDF